MEVQRTLKHNRTFALSESLRKRKYAASTCGGSLNRSRLIPTGKLKDAKNGTAIQITKEKSVRLIEDEYSLPKISPLVFERT